MTQQRTEQRPTVRRRSTDAKLSLSRRNVLRSGAIASGTLLFGGVSHTDIAAARGLGGAGFMSLEDFDKALDEDRTFKVLEADGWTMEHTGDCEGPGDGPTREYTGYLIRFAEGIYDDKGLPTLGHVYVESNRRVATGLWEDVTVSSECAVPGTATSPDGTEYEQALVQVTFRPTDFGGRAGLRAGVPVVDGEDSDPDPAVVLLVLDVPISDWTVFGTETVADQNPTYDPEERVVVVAFEHLLDAGWPDWRTADASSRFDGVVTRGIKFHAFPQSRLERVK